MIFRRPKRAPRAPRIAVPTMLPSWMRYTGDPARPYEDIPPDPKWWSTGKPTYVTPKHILHPPYIPFPLPPCDPPRPRSRARTRSSGWEPLPPDVDVEEGTGEDEDAVYERYKAEPKTPERRKFERESRLIAKYQMGDDEEEF